MRVKLSALLDSASGKIGNMVFFNHASGIQCVRQKAAIASNPRSLEQQLFRCQTSQLSWFWHNDLTAAERLSWSEFAQNQKGRRQDEDQGGGKYNLIPRSRGLMSGWNAFIGVNQRIYKCTGITDVYKEEAPVGPPPMIVGTIAASWETDIIVLSWDSASVVGEFSLPLVRIWIESYEAGAHKQLILCATASENTVNIEQVRYALGILSDLDLHPGLYRLQLDVIESDAASASGGLVSPPSEILEITVV